MAGGIIDQLSSLAGIAANTTVAFGKQRAALAGLSVGMQALSQDVNANGRGLSQMIGQNEAAINTYVGLAQQSLVLEARNKELNKTFGITSEAAAKLSQTINTLAQSHGFTSNQAIGYANSIKKMLPTMQQQGKETDATYVSLQRIQHVMTTNLGLTEEAAAAYSLYASKNGKNADTTLAFASSLSEVLQDTDGTMGYMKQALEGIAAAGAETQLQFGKLPGNLELAVIKANALGLSLDDLADTGKNLLNIESSIGQELEYQLLSGRRLVDQSGKSLTNAYREATLRGNASDMAATLNTILEQEGDVLEKNLFARQQMSELLGIDEGQLSKALQKKKFLMSDNKLTFLMDLDSTALQQTAEAMLNNGEMTKETFQQISQMNDTRTTDDIMKQQLTIGLESLAVLKSMLTTDQSTRVSTQKAAFTKSSGIQEFVTNAMVNLKDDGELQGAAYPQLVKDRVAPAAAAIAPTISGNQDAATQGLKPTDTAPDAVIPAGYGNRILTFPEDALQADIAFKNNDAIVAGTSLMDPDTTRTLQSTASTTGGGGGATDSVLMAVGNMIVAAIKSSGGNNLFGATSMNNSIYTS